MDKSTDLVAVYVPDDEHDLYSVAETGWYAVDDEDKAVLGPFASLGECDRAILDRVGQVARPSSSDAGAHAS